MHAIPEGSPANEETCAGVVGLGHAGLPLAVEMALSGCRVTGIDTDPARVREINAGRSTVADVDEGTLAGLVRVGRLQAHGDYASLEACEAVSICVPTPLRKTRDPDLTHVLEAVWALAPHLRANMLVVLESTTYPGTTEECVLPALEASGLRAGSDFHLCYSPERVDPGNLEFCTRNIPKIIGGVTPGCLEAGMAFYGKFIETLVPVSSTLAAETAKLLENTFRMVNIALANETAVLCDRMRIDVWEVIEAAASKPFGFLPFYPGPGLGGHCVPVDPHFLSWKARQAGYEPQLIRLASEINGAMPRHVVEKVQAALNDSGKPTKGSRVHLVGVAYKRNVADTRESPALDIAALLARRGAHLSYSDPYVPSIRAGALQLQREPLDEAARSCDIAVILADHDGVDYAALLRVAPMVLDTRNALAGATAPNLLRL